MRIEFRTGEVKSTKSPDWRNRYHMNPPPPPTYGATLLGIHANRPTDRPRGVRYIRRLPVIGTRWNVVDCTIGLLSAPSAKSRYSDCFRIPAYAVPRMKSNRSEMRTPTSAMTDGELKSLFFSVSCPTVWGSLKMSLPAFAWS